MSTQARPPQPARSARPQRAEPARPERPAHPAEALTARQAERRRRMLCACAELAAEGGFDGVQMREVAERSGVALGTLYRYFPSKIHLLVATMRDQLDRLHATLRRRPPGGADASERVTRTLMRAFRSLQREPRLADAMVRALTFADRSVSAEAEEVSRQTAALILEAAGLENPNSGALSAVRVIGHTWYSTMISWLAGRSSLAQVETDITTACRLLAVTADPAADAEEA